MKILLTGSTGYIGRRLAYRLLQNKNNELRLFVRNPSAVDPYLVKNCHVVSGNTFNLDSLKNALHDIDIAYYLIHSMASGSNYSELDRLSASNFKDACNVENVKRVIYLGGLGDQETGSKHLRSRIETGTILSASDAMYNCICIRAGVIIGSGSASFEIIRNLVQKLPLMLTPRWVSVKTEPVAINDVLSYLEASMDISIDKHLVVDIGAGAMTFGEMLSGCADAMGLKRKIIPLPLFSPGLSSYWLVLFTPVPLSIARELVEGLKSTTVKLNNNAERYFADIKPLTYSEAIAYAIDEIECNKVLSRWSDNLGACTLEDVPGIDVDSYVYSISAYSSYNGPREKLFKSIEQIGGETGWYRFHILWKLRGLVDRLTGGYGTRRGRRDPETLRIGDSLDFWKVVDIIPQTRLLLYSEMKLPGRGWLEFLLDDSTLTIKAYFLPKGIMGRVYWYSLIPIHMMLFHSMTKTLVKENINYPTD